MTPPLRLAPALVATALVLTACSGSSGTSSKTASTSAASTGASAPAGKTTLVVGLSGDIGQPPDPDVYYANNGLAIVLNAYEGLVQYKNDADTVQIAPRLATSWTVDKTHTVYTFTLRPGVTFHDGTPFTSAAVKASFDRRNAVKGGAAYMTAGVKSVDTSDPMKAVVTLDAPNSAFLDYLASPFGPKMQSPAGIAKYAGKDHDQTYLQTHDIGSGPYTLTSVQPGTEYDLTQYPGYWGKKSPFTKVRLPIFSDPSALQLALDKGQVDTVVAALPSSALKKYKDKKGISNYFLPTLQSALVTVNPTRSFFATVPARMAFLKTINQQQLVSQVLGERSEPATTLYAKGMIPGGADKQTITYDPSAMKAYAKTLPSGTSMSIGYASDNVNAQQMANIVAAQLQADGIKATAKGFPTSQVFGWVQDPPKGPDAFIDGNNGPDGGSPYMWGHVFWDKTGGIDYFGCDDPQTDSELNTAVKTGDTALYVSAAQKYAATGCYLNLSYNKDWVVAQSWLTGVAAAHNIGANELDFSLLGVG
ncbi:peptide/nickel transport system substrate-binding protein [Motilibacter rhizosphaerae]|uniref:Peptide/nickel transport system substrate-binding protein n=1 Tax=Motilibacter rhizosphaerae TaxID=598652 RepID=A0A4Q7NRM8_9ACTN|nr:ABC transporter substrate-binding protein [Motilibacter rhizosphaerae]RZS89711.1 peptide/nickel transport system substrate-binding protein [Motilibacter rhizosphaerae]